MKQYPVGWQVEKLGNVCTLVGGGTPAKDNASFYKGKIPWATVRDMKVDLITQTEFKITEEAIKNSSTNIIKAGNVVIATRVGLGKVCLVNQDTAINQDIRGIVPLSSDALTVRFLFWWLKSIAHLIEEEGTGATVKGVKLPFIKSLEIPLPSLPEQKRIVAILDEAFAGITRAVANAKKNLANARELFDSYLNSVFSKKGEGWVDALIEEHIKFIDYRGRTPKKTDAGMRLITAKNVKMGFLQLEPQEFAEPKIYEEWMTRGVPQKGDVLFTTEAPLGNAAQLDTDEKVLFAQRVIIMHPNRDVLKPTFLKYMLLSRTLQSILHEQATGATAKGIKASLLKKVPISFPKDTSIQEEIVSQLEALEIETKGLETIYQKKINTLAELKQSILQKAFTGELTANTVNRQLEN